MIKAQICHESIKIIIHIYNIGGTFKDIIQHKQGIIIQHKQGIKKNLACICNTIMVCHILTLHMLEVLCVANTFTDAHH